jgi:hypothetical protein
LTDVDVEVRLLPGSSSSSSSSGTTGPVQVCWAGMHMVGGTRLA